MTLTSGIRGSGCQNGWALKGQGRCGQRPLQARGRSYRVGGGGWCPLQPPAEGSAGLRDAAALTPPQLPTWNLLVAVAGPLKHPLHRSHMEHCQLDS